MSRYASDFSQEVYGDVRTYAVAGLTREARRDSLNEYLQHQASLASVAPESGDAARAFLGATYSPLANAAWQYDASFGWTNVPVELMQDYVSAQTYAMRSAGNSRFGFSWSPRNLVGAPSGDFNAQTDELLVRLAAAIADSGEAPEAACGSTWCNRTLDGAAATTAWRTFAAWKPSILAFTTPAQTLSPGVPSAPMTVELRTSSGTAYTAGLAVTVELSSSSPTGEFSTSNGGPWTATLATSIASGQSVTGFYFRDASSGSATIVAAAAGKTAATQTVTIAVPPADTTPPETTLDSGPAGTLASSAASMSFTANEAGARFECSLDGMPFAACTSPASYSGLANGAHAFEVRAIDAAGNVDSSPARGNWTVETSASPPAPPPPSSVIDPPAPLRPRSVALPTLRIVGTTPTVMARRGATASVSIRFWISDAARLQARVTPLRSTRAVPLLPGTSFAGSRSTTIRTTATATVTRGAAYLLRARLGAVRLIRGRSYLIRLTAVYTGGQRRALTIRVRA